MGVLIYLPERPEAPRGANGAVRPVAEILFFTGVRYERHQDASGQNAADLQEPKNKAAQSASSETPRPRRRRG